MTREQELHFIGANITERQHIINSTSTTPAMAEEYLSLCAELLDCDGVVNDAVAEKIDSICVGECRSIKIKARQDVNKTAAVTYKLFEKEIEKTKEEVLLLKTTSKFLTELGKSAQKWRQESHSGAEQFKLLEKKIEQAEKDGLFGKIGDAENPNPFKNLIAEELKTRARDVLGISSQGAGTFADDSLKSVIDSVDKAIRERQDLQIQHLKGMEYAKEATKNFKNKAWRELKGMSNTDRLARQGEKANPHSPCCFCMDYTKNFLKIYLNI